MTLYEDEAERRRQQAMNDDRVMRFKEWCELNGFSEATGRRIKNSGNGPIFTYVSERCVGVTVANNRAWQASRARGTAA